MDRKLKFAKKPCDRCKKSFQPTGGRDTTCHDCKKELKDAKEKAKLGRKKKVVVKVPVMKTGVVNRNGNMYPEPPKLSKEFGSLHLVKPPIQKLTVDIEGFRFTIERVFK